MSKKIINVTTTAYDGDAPFPEAEHYADYVAERLAEDYPGFSIDVGVGLRTAVHVYGDDSIDADTIATQVRVDFWDDFCAHGYENYLAA